MHRSVLDDEEATFTFGDALTRIEDEKQLLLRDVDYIQDPATGRFEGSHPQGGDDTSSSGAGGGGEKAPNPTVTAVGGDEWNKQTAARLEHEYVAAHSALDTIVKDAIGGKVSVPHAAESADDDDEPPAPDSWDTLSSDDQEQAQTDYQEANYESYYQSEVDNWHSETAPDDARYKVAQDYQSGDETEWVKEAIDGWREDRTEEGKPDIPYTDEQLMDALTVEHDTGNYPIAKGTSFDLDEKALAPQLASQQDLPGIESGITALNTLDRISLIGAISEAFNERAEDVEKDLEPPEYLSDSAKEFVGETWDQMDDEEKYNWVLHNTSIIENIPPVQDITLNQLPQKFDPLEKGGSAVDYKLTQAIAKKLSTERAAQLLMSRGYVKEPKEANHWARDLDARLWSAWKSSSTSEGGKLLQVAIAEELGGKLREHEDLKSQAIIDLANKDYQHMGGFNGIKAYIRAKWETSQYLLDKAGIQTVNVYRGVNLTPAPSWTVAEVNQTSVSAKPVTPEQAGAPENTFRARSSDGDTRYFATKEQADNFVKVKEAENPPEPVEKVESAAGREYYKYPDISVRRNGAASTTTDPKVANDWDGQSGRVVLRAEVPRTAVVSVPAYGINVHSEHEVVVAGTAWVGWDAWKGQAPNFTEVPMHHGGVTT